MSARVRSVHFGRKDAVPGVVASIPAVCADNAAPTTFGSFANFHPHVHALVTDGGVTREGTFLPLLAPDLKAVCEVFRRLVLAGLRRAEPLSEEFHDRLRAWSPTGFSAPGKGPAPVGPPGLPPRDLLRRESRHQPSTAGA